MRWATSPYRNWAASRGLRRANCRRTWAGLMRKDGGCDIKVQVRLVSGKERCLDVGSFLFFGSPIMAYLHAVREVAAGLMVRVPTVCGLCQDTARGGKLCSYCYRAVTQSMASGGPRCAVCQ